MRTNTAGVKLIERYEGIELTAYPDPGTGSDPWTIGYGHTSEAGDPVVTQGMTITQAEAESILRADLAIFEAIVSMAVTVPLTPNQFSTLVSFTYNIGGPKFRRSSVLKAVNANQFEQVPWRLQLYVKANGRTLPGLVKRRAAEAHLWNMPMAQSLFEDGFAAPTRDEILDMRKCKGGICADEGKPLGQSSIAIGTVATGAAAAWPQVKDAVYQAQEAGSLFSLDSKFMFPLLATVAIGALVAYVVNERRKLSSDDGV